MRKEVLILALALVLALNIVSANNAPIIRDLNSEFYVCESSAFSTKFTVADLDGDKISAELSPNAPFYVRMVSSKSPITEFEIFSTNLTKIEANKEYDPILFVSDGEFVDFRKIKIKVLETNNPPKIQYIPVSTVDLNTTDKFQKIIYVTDQESSLDQDFSYNVSDSLNLLGLKIDSIGIINYTTSEKHVGVHNIEVCVTDRSVKSIEGKIGFCGSSDLSSQSCSNFQLAITKANNLPTILFYNSTNLSSRIFGVEKTSFEVYTYDPDGLYPDTYWYVDSKLKEISSGESQNKFAYSFGCDVFGVHKIRAVITDGLANDSIEWKFDVVKIPCEEGILPIEKIGDSSCEEKWGCVNWDVCRNVNQSRQNGVLSEQDFLDLNRKCNVRGWSIENCGYQTRGCFDVNTCNSVKNKPMEINACYFSQNPSCSDNIQNCHDGSCEFLTDCGGPCSACASCSDGLRNNGEEGIDCGGHCTQQCIIRTIDPNENRMVKQSMLGAIIICLILASIQIIRIFHSKKILEDKTQKGLVLTYENN